VSPARLTTSLLAALLLAPACSRSSGDGPLQEASGKAENAAQNVASSAPSTSEAPLGSAGPVLTPEDVEAETEHRITEENLESELDRLEREIQAE
jgi:hypothetical protein